MSGSPPRCGVCSASQRRVAPTFHGLALAPFALENTTLEKLMAKQIGYAVVGAGPSIERALLPAFARAGEETRLAAIVSAARARAQALAQEHRATAYHYD